MRGIGGAPTRATTLPSEPGSRKKFPVATGFLDYFPDAVCAVANLSFVGNEQHNPGQPLHWARGKSQDEADTMMRHFLQRGTLDTDGVRHSVKMAWRALALLQKELEAAQQPRIGDRVLVKDTSVGAYGAIGYIGTLMSDSHQITSGLSGRGPKVRLDDGTVWGLGPSAELELVSAYAGETPPPQSAPTLAVQGSPRPPTHQARQSGVQ